MKIVWEQLQDVLLSVRFLTVIPVPGPWIAFTEARGGRRIAHTGSLFYYPLVGALIGTVLIALQSVTASSPGWVAAALLLGAWVLITGGLHLDGLADSADAWVGGHGDKDKTLRILNDTHCGASAIIALILVLLLKFACLGALNESASIALLISPMIARAAVIGLLMSTPYVREHGIATETVKDMAMARLLAMQLLVAMMVIVMLGWDGFWIMFSVVVAVGVYRYLLVKRIGGVNGDTAGALIELGEVWVLLGVVLLRSG